MANTLVVIASSSEAVRRRWRQALAGSFPNYEVDPDCGFYESIGELQPGVLVYDLDRSHFGGPRHVSALLRASPSTRIILLTSTPSDSEGIAAIKAGAKGYCNKNITNSLFKKAVERVEHGEIWVARRLGAMLLEELIVVTNKQRRAALARNTSPSVLQRSLECLSLREHEIANLIACGDRNKEISNRLSISEKTVKAHLTTIYRKLGLSDRLQLAVYLSSKKRPSNGQPQSPQSTRLWTNVASAQSPIDSKR